MKFKLISFTLIIAKLLLTACAPATPATPDETRSKAVPVSAPLEVKAPEVSLDMANSHPGPQPDCGQIPEEFVQDLGDYLVLYGDGGMILILSDMAVDYQPSGKQIAFGCGSYENEYYKFFLTEDGHLMSLNYAFRVHTNQ